MNNDKFLFYRQNEKKNGQKPMQSNRIPELILILNRIDFL